MKFVTLSKRTLIKSLICVLLIGLIIASVGLTKTSGVFLNKPLTKKSPINSIETDKKVLNISVELGTNVELNTSIINQILEYKIPISVFVSGQNVDSNTDLITSLLNNENIEFGIMGNTPTDNTTLKSKEIAQEIQAGRTILEKVIDKKIELYRAPFGKYNDTVIDTVEKEGLFPINGDINTGEYVGATTAELARKLISKIKNGSIINVSLTDDYAKDLLSIGVLGLKSLGYSFERLGNSLIRDNYTVDSDGRQSAK